ncbi:MAG: hypothetical protein M3R01_12215 [Actinomycetota bacterium]|nr:hypothetical protein [Actinomycetota bacterium]
MVEIVIARGASTMKMHSCSACDSRWWDDDGRRVDLNHVLGRVASHRS